MEEMSRLDGNALAGALSSLFAGDPTTLTVECRGCGETGMLADTDVERDAVAAIVRCRSCTHTLFTVMEHGEGVRVVIESLGAISVTQ